MKRTPKKDNDNVNPKLMGLIPLDEYPHLSSLYDYQIDAHDIINEKKQGIIVLPTGTGKTYLQAACIGTNMIENPGFGIYVVLAPRIMLTMQLQKEIFSFNARNKLHSCRYLSVHSGSSGDNEEYDIIRNMHNVAYSKLKSTTTTHEIKDSIELADRKNEPLIIFSTYNSAHRIQEAIDSFNVDNNITIRVVYSDEAHYLIQDRFYDILGILKSEKKFFFTATIRTTPSDKGRGMKNTDSYGEVLYSMTPKEAISMGKMVKPGIMRFSTDILYTDDDMIVSTPHIIKRAMEEHFKVLNENKKRLIQPKLLVSVAGTDDIKNFLSSKEYFEFISDRDTRVYSVASREDIGSCINGKPYDRATWLKMLKADSEKNLRLIVLHYDILSEGIDISNFTGIMPLRNMDKAKFLQTYGRAARLHVEDREKLEKGLITPDEHNKMVKPNAWVLIPDFITKHRDSVAHFRNIIKDLMSVGFMPEEDVILIDDPKGEGEDEDLEGLNELSTKSKSLNSIIKDIMCEVDDFTKPVDLDVLEEVLNSTTQF